MKKTLITLIVLSLVLVTGCSNVNTNKEKKALLVVSFGSSFIENRSASIDATEDKLKTAFSNYDFFNAFTSQIIIDIYKDRDNIEYKNVAQQIESIYKAGYGEVLVVPTHVINGEEYDQMKEALQPFEDKFASMKVSTPLLTSIHDYDRVVESLAKEFPETDDKTAIVLMGHGTHHHANSAYATLDYKFKHAGYENVYVGTVEGMPEFDDVLGDIKQKDYENILLMPCMIVAGDHAHNDMAGDEEDSWKVMFKAEGYNVETVMKGLGELESIQNLFIEHATTAQQESNEG